MNRKRVEKFLDDKELVYKYKEAMEIWLGNAGVAAAEEVLATAKEKGTVNCRCNKKQKIDLSDYDRRNSDAMFAAFAKAGIIDQASSFGCQTYCITVATICVLACGGDFLCSAGCGFELAVCIAGCDDDGKVVA